MKLLSLILSFATIIAAAVPVPTDTSHYKLKAVVLPTENEGLKSHFSNLWLSSYHTGAGLNDVVFTTDCNASSVGNLSSTNLTSSTTPYYNQLFDLGTDFLWGLQMAQSDTFYAAWQPVRMNAGVSGNLPQVFGFFLNDTGLQWTSTSAGPGTPGDAFGGWMGRVMYVGHVTTALLTAA